MEIDVIGSPGNQGKMGEGRRRQWFRTCRGSKVSQVIVYGTHPETGECRQFPTPCDVPEGWEVSYEGCPGDQEGKGEAGECESDDDCFVGGCSGQVCSSDEEVMTTCEWREE